MRTLVRDLVVAAIAGALSYWLNVGNSSPCYSIIPGLAGGACSATIALLRDSGVSIRIAGLTSLPSAMIAAGMTLAGHLSLLLLVLIAIQIVILIYIIRERR